jgi:hypothetical protein
MNERIYENYKESDNQDILNGDSCNYEEVQKKCQECGKLCNKLYSDEEDGLIDKCKDCLYVKCEKCGENVFPLGMEKYKEMNVCYICFLEMKHKRMVWCVII